MVWVNDIIQGVLTGGLYALFACGLSLMFGVMKVVNLAHGDLAVVGAYIALGVITVTHVPALWSFLIVVPIMAVLGYGMQRTLIQSALDRGVLTTLLAVAGIVTLVIEQAHLQGAITTKIASVTAGVGTTFNIASYFIVSNAPAYWVALGLLGAAALYNAVSAFFVVTGPEAEELPPPDMGLPPPSGMRPAWPGLSPAGGWWRRSARGKKQR